jgi:hypothetical protein
MLAKRNTKLHRGTNSSSHATNIAASLRHLTEKKWWEDTTLSVKYFHYLQKHLVEFIEQRNAAAHDNHIEFARYLMNPRAIEKGHSDFYAPLFPVLYGGTVEEVARRPDSTYVEFFGV